MKNKGISLIVVIIIIVVILVTLGIGITLFSKNKKVNNEKYNQEDTKIEDNKNIIGNVDEKNFEYEEIDEGIAIIRFKNNDNIEFDKIVIPDSIDGKKVIAIGRKYTDDRVMQSVIGNCEVVIPKTVKFIGPWSFSNSNGVTKVSGGENVEAIYGKAFYKCSNLSEVTFLNKVKWFSDSAFSSTPLSKSALEIKKTSTPRKSMLKNFSFLENMNEKIGTGGIICTYDRLMKLDENNYIIPISSVINA